MSDLPLPGPLHTDPTPLVTDTGQARQMLAAAVTGIRLGPWDQQVLGWIGDKDISVVATVASILRRALEHGIELGQTETVETTPAVAVLATEVDRLTRDLRAANDTIADLQDRIADLRDR